MTVATWDDRQSVESEATSDAGPGTVNSLSAWPARFLAEVTEVMSGTLDPHQAAVRLADLVVPRLSDEAIVFVREPDGHLRPWAHAGHAFADGRGAGPEITPGDSGGHCHRLPLGSCVILPLRADSETVASLTMIGAPGTPPSGRQERGLLCELSRRASVGLGHAIAYDAQRSIAETLQGGLLGPAPRLKDLDVGVRYLPGASGMHVGGDWYDAILKPDGDTLLVVGDVVGHDAASAAVMGQFRGILRGIALDRQPRPSRLLSRVDGAIDDLGLGSLATVLVARWQASAGRSGRATPVLSWPSAGHPPPLLLRPGHPVRVLRTPPEPLLGTGSTARRHDHSIRLRPGDTVLLYTDGLVEQGRTLLDEGTARLVAALSGLGHLPVDRLCDALLARIVDDEPDDDIVLVAVHCPATT